MEQPPRKRVRLDPQAESALATRTNDDIATSLEVDHMILDYLIFQAINTCFANLHQPSSYFEDNISPVDRSLSQVDEFLALFKTRYPAYKLDAEICFRQLLLQVVALFSQRLTRTNNTPPQTSLSALRKRNRERAHTWIESADRIPTPILPIDLYASALPLTPQHLAFRRTQVLKNNSIDLSQDDHYGKASSLSLLDLLPLFMKLSAVFQNLLNISVSKTWCKLALELMLQACLEQYLIYGSSETDALDEAFAWGYKPSGGDQEEDRVNEMFKDDESEREIPGWKEMRQRMLARLCPEAGQAGDLVDHLRALAMEYPMRRTEDTILDYLKGLAQSIAEPVLVQLEKGKLEGMTKQQTQEFMRDCGLAADVFLSGDAVMESR